LSRTGERSCAHDRRIVVHDGGTHGCRRPAVRVCTGVAGPLASPAGQGHHGWMSRESLGSTAPGLAVDDPVADLDAVPGPDQGTDRDGGRGGRPTRRQPQSARPRGVPRRLVVALVALGVVVGALGGATSVRQQARAAADAGTRVVIALDDLGGPGLGGPPAAGDALVLVTVALTGGVDGSHDAVVESVRTPFGDLALFPAVRLSDSGPGRQTLLRGRFDCSGVRADVPVDGRLLVGSVARVRPAGSRRTVDVPVVVATPTAGIPALEQRCAPPGPERIAPFTVSGMTARTDGTAVLVVAPLPVQQGAATPRGPVRFGLVHFDPGAVIRSSTAAPYSALVPLRADADTATFALPDTAWTVTTSPPVPFEVTATTTVRLRFGYTCPRAPRRAVAPGVPPFPDDVSPGAIWSDGGITFGVEGWQDQAFAGGAVAAAVAACPPTRTAG
jgi:hypothetical protein